MKNLLRISYIILGIWLICTAQASARKLVPAPLSFAAEPLPFAAALPSKEITVLHQDKEGFLWIGTTHGLARFDGHETALFKSDYFHPNLLTHNYITPITDNERYVCIGTKSGLNLFDKQTWRLFPAPHREFQQTEIKYQAADRKGQVWIATAQALYRCDKNLNILSHYALGAGVNAIYEDLSGRIWVLTWGKGIYLWNSLKDTFRTYPKVGTDNIPFVLYQDHAGRYWLGTWGNGLYRFYPDESEENMYIRQPARGNVCYDITQDAQTGRLWTLTYDALQVFDCSPDGVLQPMANPLPAIDRNRMYSTILNDHDGNLWLGAFDAGYFLTPPPEEFRYHSLPSIKANTEFDANLNCIVEDGEGILWFNQERYGVGLYNLNTGTSTLADLPLRTSIEVNRLCLSHRKNSVWMSSSFVPVVFRAQREDMQFHFTDTLKLTDCDAEAGTVTKLLEDKHENLWILTERQLYVKPRNSTQVFKLSNQQSGTGHITENTKGNTGSIAEDTEGNVWLGSSSGQLYQLKLMPKGVVVQARYSSPRFFHPQNTIRNMCGDNRNRLWISTSLSGVYCFDPQTKMFTDYTTACQTSGAPILNLLLRGEELWIITPNAVIRHNLIHHTNRTYSTQDKHIPIHTFRNSAACWSNNGMLYAGGHGGLLAINPLAQTRPEHHHKVELADIRIDGQSAVYSTQPHSVKQKTVHVLPATSKQIEFSFSNLNFAASQYTRYAYRIKELNAEWTTLKSGQHTVTYNHIPKGKYTLQVALAEHEERPMGSISSYTLIKQAAWFETGSAYGCFFVVLLALVWLIAYRYAKYLQDKNRLQLKKELTQAKIEYFTNVSHELLTPLTVLSCLVDEIERKLPYETEFVSMMRENVTRLRKLIKQVLDFRKVEKKSLPLQVTYGDIASFIRCIGQANFELLAQKKQIGFHIDISPDNIYGFFDADKLEDILFNLLSNAVKYTSSQKHIGIRARLQATASRKTIRIEVWDEGIGIATEEQAKVFTRFYRSPQSSGGESNGIGLALTRELVSLHHGELILQSQLRQGSCFTVLLPLDKDSFAQEEFLHETDTTFATENLQKTPVSSACILVVDDNPEILQVIQTILKDRYHMLGARSATQAQTILQDTSVDLIICDLMMPGINGLEFCTSLKHDFNTSHIPLIILTAQHTEEARTACYEAGADGFLNKPFETSTLLARIENLLHQYRLQQLRFQHHQDTDNSNLHYQDADKKFLNEMVKAVETHLTDTDFRLEVLAAELHLSKSTMNRKIKSMTGLPPMDFVKNIRMKSACRLLRKGGGQSISEIAYAVGFNDPKYFAKCFKEEFGITPTQYQQRPSDQTP